MKTFFESYLKIAGSYGVFDCRFGICVKSYVYRDVFVIIIDLYGELGAKSCFWQKSCLCCSRTVCNGSEKNYARSRVGNVRKYHPLFGNLFFYPI